VPYGIYDLPANSGWVSVGVDHDTAAFAVNSIRQWWLTVGRARHPEATRLLITADGGGSKGSRVPLWKRELQKLANELALDIAVSHLPPGTSKWNKIGVSPTHRQREEMWSCARDEGRPLEAGSQVQASNHCKLRSSRAMVVIAATSTARPAGSLRLSPDKALAPTSRAYSTEFRDRVIDADQRNVPLPVRSARALSRLSTITMRRASRERATEATVVTLVGL
jgi:DDE family transposase